MSDNSNSNSNSNPDLPEFINPPDQPFIFMDTGPIQRLVFSKNTYFKDKPKYDIRMWFKGEHDGKWRASKKGINMEPELYQEFINMVHDLAIIMEDDHND